MNHLVFFGAPCAGKGTQSTILTQAFPFVHISVGDMLRNESAYQSSIGKAARDFVRNGTMVPNELIVKMVKKRIDSLPEDTKFIFDGIPRTMEQTIDFNQILGQKQIVDLTFILLNVSRPELVRRANVRAMRDRRIDDQNDAVIANRITIYEEFTVPVINSYSNITTIQQVNGEQSIQKVYEDVLAIT